MVLGELGHFFTIDSPHLPVGTHVEKVRSELERCAATTADCSLVSAHGLDHLGDQLHFDTASLYTFGERYAEAWAELDLAGSWRFGVPSGPPPALLPPAFSFPGGAAGKAAADQWQPKARAELRRLLVLGDPESADGHSATPEVEVLREDTMDGVKLMKLGYASAAGPGATAWLAIPPGATADAPKAGVLALPGHGGDAEEVVRGSGGYGYGAAMLARGWVVLSVDIQAHSLRHRILSPAAAAGTGERRRRRQRPLPLMGQRVADMLAGVSILASRPEVDAGRLGTAGLSLGGEAVMHVAALDTRLRVAVSSGWPTTTANMRRTHCPCWNFPGLEQSFEFSDIFGCVAPRRLLLENGLQEPVEKPVCMHGVSRPQSCLNSPFMTCTSLSLRRQAIHAWCCQGGFPTPVARACAAAVEEVYRVLGGASSLEVHPGGHEFSGIEALPVMEQELGLQ